MIRVLARSALLVALIPLACVDRPGTTSESATGTGDGSSSTSTGSTTPTTTDSTSTSASSSSGGSSSSSSGGETGGACETDEPWLDPLGPGGEPCEFASEEACVTEDALAGFRVCLGFEIAEDMTEFSWGPCMPSCGPDQREEARACGPGDAGISYCSELLVNGASEHVWFPCLDPRCLPCTPGDTELCGPDTPYPDTLKTCILSQGVPVWFTGDCYT